MSERNDCIIANWMALEDAHEEIARELKPLWDDAHCSNLALLPGRRGFPTLQATDDQHSYYLHSLYDPVGESRRLVRTHLESLDRPPQVLVILGMGLGYTVEAALEQCDPTTRILVIEPDLGVCKTAFATRDLTEVLRSDNITWVLSRSVDESAHAVLISLNTMLSKNLSLLITPVMGRHYRDFQDDLVYRLTSGLNLLHVGMVTDINRSELMMTNTLKNLAIAAKSPGIEHLVGQWKGRPAIIASSGPSLEQHYDLLRELDDRILLIASGSAWRILQAQDIEPHFVVAADPSPAYLKYFRGLKSRGTTMIASSILYPEILREFDGPLYLVHDTPQYASVFNTIYGTRGILSGGGSVAHMVFSLLFHLQADPIIFVGQDLAYSQGKSHAEGHFDLSQQKEDQRAGKLNRIIPGYYGGEVRTTVQLDSYRFWFEEAIRKYSHLNVVNATEGGARIAGTTQMPLAEAIATYQLESSEELSHFLSHASNCSPPNELAETIGELKKLRRELRGIQRLGKRCLKFAEKLSKQEENTPAYNELAIKLARVEKKLIGKKGRAKTILDAFTRPATFYVMTDTDEKLQEADEISQTSVLLYRSIYSGCERALKVVEDSLQDVLALVETT